MQESSFSTGPSLLVDTGVFNDRITLEQRIEIFGRFSLSLSLATVSKLIGRIDLSHLRSSPQEIEEQWITPLPGPLGTTLLGHLRQGRHTLDILSVVQCLKEVVEHSDPTSTKAITRPELAKCLLGINGDIDRATTTSPASWSDLQDELTLLSVARLSFYKVDMLQTLGAEVDSLWRRTWPADTPPGLTADLPDSAGGLFTEVTGVEQEELFFMCLALWQHCSKFDRTVLSKQDLLDLGVTQPALEFMLREASLPLPELRAALINERNGERFAPWLRYTLQRYPVAQLPNGKLAILRLQYFFQRFMARPPYFDVLSRIPRDQKTRSKHFEGAFKHQFETVIRESLNRIVDLDRSKRSKLITNIQMEQKWNPSSGNQVSTCDFAVVEGPVCVLVDANHRAVVQAYAEGRGTSADFRDELKSKYKKKFEQLTATVRHFDQKGWTEDDCVINSDTKFVPLVLAPDDGLPNDELIELMLREVTEDVVAEFGGRVLPPTVLRHTELVILEGLVEHRAFSATNLLARWRLAGLDGRALPVSFQTYVTDVLREPTYPSSFHRQAADAHSIRMMRRFFHYQLRHLRPAERDNMVEAAISRMRAEA